MWVAVVPCCISGLLTMPVLGSPGCEWLWCLAMFLACWQCCPWLFREWVAVVPCCFSSLLTMPILGSSGSEWLWCLVVFLACWQCLSLTLQPVSSCDALLALLCLQPADNAGTWLSSWWVAVVPCYVSSLLTISVLGSSVCEWLWCLAVFLACWQCLFMALQAVSGCDALLFF